jgi:archaellum component FlaC
MTSHEQSRDMATTDSNPLLTVKPNRHHEKSASSLDEKSRAQAISLGVRLKAHQKTISAILGLYLAGTLDLP